MRNATEWYKSFLNVGIETHNRQTHSSFPCPLFPMVEGLIAKLHDLTCQIGAIEFSEVNVYFYGRLTCHFAITIA